MTRILYSVIVAVDLVFLTASKFPFLFDTHFVPLNTTIALVVSISNFNDDKAAKLSLFSFGTVEFWFVHEPLELAYSRIQSLYVPWKRILTVKKNYNSFFLIQWLLFSFPKTFISEKKSQRSRKLKHIFIKI